MVTYLYSNSQKKENYAGGVIMHPASELLTKTHSQVLC